MYYRDALYFEHFFLQNKRKIIKLDTIFHKIIVILFLKFKIIYDLLRKIK